MPYPNGYAVLGLGLEVPQVIVDGDANVGALGEINKQLSPVWPVRNNTLSLCQRPYAIVLTLVSKVKCRLLLSDSVSDRFVDDRPTSSEYGNGCTTVWVLWQNTWEEVRALQLLASAPAADTAIPPHLCAIDVFEDCQPIDVDEDVQLLAHLGCGQTVKRL